MSDEHDLAAKVDGAVATNDAQGRALHGEDRWEFLKAVQDRRDRAISFWWEARALFFVGLGLLALSVSAAGVLLAVLVLVRWS